MCSVKQGQNVPGAGNTTSIIPKEITTAGDAAISYLKVTRNSTLVQDGRALTRQLMEASLNWKTVPMECSGWKCSAHAVKAIWDMYFPMGLEKPPVSDIA